MNPLLIPLPQGESALHLARDDKLNNFHYPSLYDPLNPYP